MLINHGALRSRTCDTKELIDRRWRRQQDEGGLKAWLCGILRSLWLVPNELSRLEPIPPSSNHGCQTESSLLACGRDHPCSQRPKRCWLESGDGGEERSEQGPGLEKGSVDQLELFAAEQGTVATELKEPLSHERPRHSPPKRASSNG
ncbi:hypothetical protein LIA77_09495 [Sarocladium implicatum]|nr:hypothetical protein LIA77_09495 [Sarocladium implicatum]